MERKLLQTVTQETKNRIQGSIIFPIRATHSRNLAFGLKMQLQRFTVDNMILIQFELRIRLAEESQCMDVSLDRLCYV